MTANGEFVFVADPKEKGRFNRVPVQPIARNALQMSLAETPAIHAGVGVVGDGAILLEGILEGED